MLARDVQRAAGQLRDFQVCAWEHFGLAALSFVLALVASQLLPSLGVPLLIGGIACLALGVRDEVRRWELIDRVVLDRDAHSIPVVRERAEQAATMQSRRALASSVRVLLDRPELAEEPPVCSVVEELGLLAASLDDPELELDPGCAVACRQLLSDPVDSPLRNPAASVEDARARIVQILNGFAPRRV